MPRKKKNNVISIANKTNEASRYNTKELLTDVLDSDFPDNYEKCLCIMASEVRKGEFAHYKFPYFVAGFRSRIELLGILEIVKNMIAAELEE